MKTLLLSNYLPYPPDTGTKMRTLNFVKYFSQKGKLTVLAPGDLEKDAANEAALKEFCQRIAIVDGRVFGPNSKAADSLSAAERWTTPWSLQDFVSRAFYETLMALDPASFDLIFIRYPQLAYYFLTVPELSRLLPKTIIDVDDVGILMIERRVAEMPLHYAKLRNLLDLSLLKKYYKKMKQAKACLITNMKDQEYLERNGYAQKAFIVPNTIAVNGFHRPAEVSAPEILFCGTLSFPHNEEAIIYFCDKIFPLILKEIPNAKVSIVGKNPGPKIFELGRRDGVDAVGPVPSMQPYYEKSAIAIVPLLNGAGTRIKILEAMAHKTPVVSTSIGAEGIDVAAEENILIGDTPEKFASGCVRLLKSRELCRRISDSGYELVKRHYDDRVFGERMDHVLNFFSEKACRA